ncbi:TonB-dependent receptor [Eisenibacter elegans]|jgi:TonB-dependent receptor|uniref:TonB-dependent receptor n=1 Tax=Eisenibacter elegans TaxID=997 RepID=UPI000413F215|nr:TonB-dependent receptor [Eisenibacter elegans]
MKRFILTILLLCTSLAYGFAQTGTIRGKLVDEANGEEIIGATVIIEGTTTGTITDINGDFVINNAPVGTHTLVISYVSYKTKKMEGLRVEAGKVTVLNTSLEEDVQSLGEVVVVAERETNSMVSVLKEIRQAKQVVSGISAEQIAKSLDGNSAQVMTRVPGVTIVDGRFVMIRGVSDRYNAVMINNAYAPSTEIDSRSFSFDLLPSNVLDRMLIYKSGAAEYPGDFAGGVIKMYTRHTVDENFTTISVGTAFRQNTTFEKAFFSQGSATDVLGFDNGFRSIPNTFPNNLRDLSRNSTELQNIGRSLPNNFDATESMAAPDVKLGFAMGRKFNLFNRAATNLTAINYSNTAQFQAVERYRYGQFEPSRGQSPQLYRFEDSFYGRNVRLGIISNFNLRLNANNSLSFKNMYNQLSEHETTFRNGFNFFQRSELFNNYAYYYLSRSIYSGQIEGNHEVSDRTSINWVFSANYINRSEPDYRRFRRVESTDEPGTFVLIDPPNANPFDAGRFYSSLNEIQVGNGFNYQHKLGANLSDEESKKLKLGYYVDYRARNFSARYFSYVYPGFDDPVIKDQLLRLPNSQIFAPENISRTNGFRLDEGTNASDTYTGTQLLTAGYASLELPLDRWTLAFGGRAEYNIQTLTSALQSGEAVNVNNPIFAALPFANIAYNFNTRSLMRVAYGRTVNRPEFRELAPFLFYDFNKDVNIVGNPNLGTAFIDNLDLRYEFYPSPSQTVIIGGFYKRFTNPIEQRVAQVADGQQFSFINADFANNLGVELELRKEFIMASSPVFKYLTLVLNTSYIYSRVDLGEAIQGGQDRERALQGQSPYIVNLASFWENPKTGWSFNAFYNVFGPRIFTVGDSQFPTIYELQRHSIDLTVGKKIKALELRAGVQDLLNFKYRFYQDSNRDAKIDLAVDEPIFLFRRGALYSLTATYQF